MSDKITQLITCTKCGIGTLKLEMGEPRQNWDVIKKTCNHCGWAINIAYSPGIGKILVDYHNSWLELWRNKE